MRINALDSYSFNISYSNINGNKVLKEKPNSNNKNKTIKDKKFYNSKGFIELENKGIYIDLFV